MNLAVRVLRHPTCLLALLVPLAAGCSQLHRRPPVAPTTQILKEELRRHAEFLSDPSLKGRKCRTSESRTARHYIRQSFEDAGLQPWGRSHGFDQSFALGTNIVGVLPGSDKHLSDQVILVCAHYDGPGVVNGKLLPDAAGSATAVAAMLDIARQLAGSKHRLHRSVAFAAFDCGNERYLGAFAFTARKDFDPARIAAVVDLDMLGRPLFNVIGNTVLAIGATDDPRLRQTVAAAGEATKLRTVPLGSDLAGPIGDYFAFQQWPIPCLLLTNGLYSDYYKPTDTAQKIDYELLERTANTAAIAIRDLANQQTIDRLEDSRRADRDELAGIATVVEEVRTKAAANDLTADEVRMLENVSRQARQLLASPTYTPKDRRRYLSDILAQGAPSIVRFLHDPPKPEPSKALNPQQTAVLLRLQAFFAGHSAFAAGAMQQVVRHFTEGWTLLRLLGSFNYSACDINSQEIVYQQHVADDRLSLLYPHLTIQAGLAGRRMDVKWSALDFRGDTGQAVDYCLLTWSSQQDDCLNAVMPRVLHTITNRRLGQQYQAWLDWRQEQVAAKDEAEWLAGLWRSGNPLLLKSLLARAAGGKHTDVPTARLVEIIGDPRMRVDVRADAVRALPGNPGNDALRALADTLDDHRPAFQRAFLPALDPTFPFYDNVIMQLARKYPEPHDRATLAEVAQRKLVALTGQDFGNDPQAWRGWIEGGR